MARNRLVKAAFRFLILHEPRFTPASVRKILRRALVRDFQDDGALARVAFQCYNQKADDRADNDAPEIIERATALNYLSWPKKIQHLVGGREVVDIGCGTGVHGVGYVVVGARRYVGVDPRVELQRDRVKDLRTGAWVDFGWTANEIMQRMPRIEYCRGGVEQLPADALFDVAVMHNVTEHLPDLAGVFASVAQHLRPSGELVFNHHNFYAWNGHHLAPKRVSDIDLRDAEQRNYLDWGHLTYEAPPDHYFHRGLNKLRIEELRLITQRFYDIKQWDLIPSDPEQGAGRLKAPIRARHPGLSETDFTIQYVYCRAQPKAGALSGLPQGEEVSH
ncbi:MAG: methyltransferase domain-containing protein [Thiohalocapsa sp.]